MIRYLYADQLATFPALQSSMFRDRAEQFSNRLGWDVSVDAKGFERDQYDALNPLYVIWLQADGSHGGSMRFLPTVGPVMVNDYFTHLTDGVTIKSPLIWECTRFCLSPNMGGASPIPARLMLAAAHMGRKFQLAHAVGVFDARMIRIYRALGWPPKVLGTSSTGKAAISVGIWDFDKAPMARLTARAKVDATAPHLWLKCAFDVAGNRRLCAV